GCRGMGVETRISVTPILRYSDTPLRFPQTTARSLHVSDQDQRRRSMPATLTPRAVWPLLKRTVAEWSEDKVPKMAAALAYYTAVAIAPLLIITIKIIGVVLGPKAAANQLQGQLAQFTDPQIAKALQEAIHKAGQPGSG